MSADPELTTTRSIASGRGVGNLLALALLVVSPLAVSSKPGLAQASSQSEGAIVAVRPPTGPFATTETATWRGAPRASGRISNRELGVVINTADPYSVDVGEFYVKARKIPPDQVLRLALPTRLTLTADEFKAFDSRVRKFFKPSVQALALAWSMPFAVGCNSITAALTLGYDEALCAQTCGPSKPSPYFNAATSRPFSDLKLRPSMLLAAPDAAAARRLVERGIASDHSLGPSNAPPVNVFFVETADTARNVRARLFPPPGPLPGAGVNVHVESAGAAWRADRVLIYETGLVRVDRLDDIHWVPGALADHLTSDGGQLQNFGGGQMSATEWIGSGATASYGTVSEPCNHVQKFPHPQVLLLHYLQGSTALEAYWKSVAWPQQGVFIGEPLASPFAPRR